MKLKLLPLQLMGAMMARYRKMPARAEIDCRQLTEQRIALVKLDAIGDFILATSFLRVFQSRLPQANVTLFCRQPVGQLARHQFPEWSVVEIPWPRKKVARKILLDRKTRRWIQSQPPFDLLLDLRAYRDFIETTLASWIPARQKIALKNPRQPANGGRCLPDESCIYDQLLDLPDYGKQTILPDLQNHELLAKYLFPDLPAGQLHRPRLTVSDAEKQLMIRRLAPSLNTPFLLACPGAGSPIREYPVEKLAKAVISAVARIPLPVVVAGGKPDAAAAEKLSDALRQEGIKTFNLTGTLNLAEHLAVMSLARVVLCMETSHAHIAGALGRPAVAIIGGGHYGIFAPWGESKTFRWVTHQMPCFGCNWKCIYDRPLCIQDVPAEMIAKNLTEVLTVGAPV